jgi:hypothetical protein
MNTRPKLSESVRCAGGGVPELVAEVLALIIIGPMLRPLLVCILTILLVVICFVRSPVVQPSKCRCSKLDALPAGLRRAGLVVQ